MAFSFLQRGSLSEHARQLTLTQYLPTLVMEGLQTGVDNVRSDVYLSPRFADIARQHITRLIVQYGDVKDLSAEERKNPQRPPSLLTPRSQPGAAPPQQEAADFKKVLIELLSSSVQRAHAENNVNLDLLARVAVIKFLRGEMQSQFAQVLERCRAKMKGVDTVRQLNVHKVHEVRERFSRFQISKRIVLRKVGQELFATMREAEKEQLARLRRAYFGDVHEASYDLLLNRLLFTEDGRDDYINAEHYVMLGNYEKDPDRFSTLLDITCQFIKALQPELGESECDALLNVPENAHELAGTGAGDPAKQKAQRAVLAQWIATLENQDVIDYIIAAYETAAILSQYSPPLNPQQLKNALVSKTERKRIESLMEEARLSADGFASAAKRVEQCKGEARAKVAARFLLDFFRYHRDLRRFEAVSSAMDGVNLLANEKLRELSAINNTLYEYLTLHEARREEEKVLRHVILKADVRESTALTRSLSDAGLNPASYFSLNFFDPINRLIPKYGASKVFIEGDAIILAIFQREGEPGFAVSRACMLAREMVAIVGAYNQISIEKGLPPLEIGIGITAQEGPPMYLMDGTHPIMISAALNESDRLSSCSKNIRHLVDASVMPFRVFLWVPPNSGEGPWSEELLARYNVSGVRLSKAAYESLGNEIALQRLDIPNRMNDDTQLSHGLVPIANESFHPIIVRVARAGRLQVSDGSAFTDLRYFEVCTDDRVYALLERSKAAHAS